MSRLLTRYTLLIPGRACDGLYASYNINSTSFWKHYSEICLFWRDNVMHWSCSLEIFYSSLEKLGITVQKITVDHQFLKYSEIILSGTNNCATFKISPITFLSDSDAQFDLWGGYLNRVYKTIMQSLPHDWLNKYLYHFKSGILRIILAQWHSLRNKGFSIKVLKDHSVRSNICNFSSWQGNCDNAAGRRHKTAAKRMSGMTRSKIQG